MTLLKFDYMDSLTVTPKSVTISNLKPGREAPRNHPWESHFALVEPNRVQTPGYFSDSNMMFIYISVFVSPNNSK